MKICIDAGHNYSGWDTGAEGHGLKEQNITYPIAAKLKALFESVGVDIIMTRNTLKENLGTSFNSALKQRAKLSNQHKCDYFISIHCNAHANKSATGTEVLVYKFGGEAEKIAKLVQKELIRTMGTVDRGVKEQNVCVLRETDCPAILVETAFITNKKDNLLLRDRQDDFAKAIFNGVCSYLNIKKDNTPKVETVVKPVNDKPQPFTYHIEGTTHIIEVDPRQIWAVETQCETNKTPYDNFVNALFFVPQANGVVYPQGIMVNAGQVIANNPTHGKPVATLIVYSKDDVQMKYIDDITKEKNVWFAVSGYGIYPKLTATQEGFVGEYSDVTRTANRPIIGYRKKDNKIVIAVRADSSASRAQLTARNLGLDFAISLDGGGSTTLKVNKKYKFTGDGRKLFGGIIWA